MTALQPGDFILRPIQGVGGKLIRFGQWLNGDGFSVYEHAATVTSVHPGWVTVVEAWPGKDGARSQVYTDAEQAGWLTSADLYARLGVTKDQRDRIVAMAVSLRGTGYSVLDYLALAAHRFHLPVPGLRHYIGTSRHLICSQMVDECAQFGGVHLFSDGRCPGWVTPGDLAGLITGRATAA